MGVDNGTRVKIPEVINFKPKRMRGGILVCSVHTARKMWKEKGATKSYPLLEKIAVLSGPDTFQLF